MGHATRCVPIINALIKANFEPLIASDGDALLLLQKEFPNLKSYKLPSYNIRYPKKGKSFKINLLFQIPSIISAVKRERKFVSYLIEKEQLKGVISDNRFGVYSSKVPSVYITHQLEVLSGRTTCLTTYIHQKIIKKFNECWIPDVELEPNVSGKLGHIKNNRLNLKYIGVLSRFQPKKIKIKIKYDLLVLLSGPEPQRSILENKLFIELKNFKGSALFVRGVLNDKLEMEDFNKVQIVNYLLSNKLEKAIIESDIVLARSGYSTIMDLAVLGKKAFFIPTSGQYEQEYLANYMSVLKIAPFSSQYEFRLENIQNIENFRGFKNYTTNNLNIELFSLFNGE